MLGRRVLAGQGLAGEAHHQPGCDDHGDEEREHHGRRGIDRDRRHVGTHQARDEQHRQKGRDHGQGGDDRRIADLGDGLDRGVHPASTVVHRPMPGDVLDHDDGVVDQDADREDQGEQADPVDRVAQKVRGEEGQKDRGGDDHGGDASFPPTDGEADQDDDRDRGQGEVLQQLIGLIVGAGPVVAGDSDIEAVRQQRALQRLHPRQNGLGDHDRVGALALGDG